MNRDQILAADIRVTQLMDVRELGTSNPAGAQFAVRVVAQAVFSVVVKSRFPQNAFMHQNSTVRTVVIMNRRALSGLPAKHQHLNKIIAHHAVAAIVAGLETLEG